MHGNNRGGVRIALEGGILQLVGGSLGLACLLLDLGWSQPALPNEWDPEEPQAKYHLLVTSVALLYVFSSVPSTILYWRFVRAGTVARMVHLFFGCLLLVLATNADTRSQDFYTSSGWHGAQWSQTLNLLSISLAFCAIGYMASFSFEEAAVFRAVVFLLKALAKLMKTFLSNILVLLTRYCCALRKTSFTQPLLDVNSDDEDVESRGAQESDESQRHSSPAQDDQRAGQRHIVRQGHRDDNTSSPRNALAAFCIAGHAPFVFGCSAYILALSVCAFSMILSFYSFEPNTHCFAWLKENRDARILVSTSIGSAYRISDQLALHVIGESFDGESTKASLIVQDELSASGVLWESLPGRAFLVAGYGVLESWNLGGVMSFQDTLQWNTDMQTVDAIVEHSKGVKVSGRLLAMVENDPVRVIRYTANFVSRAQQQTQPPQQQEDTIRGFDLHIELDGNSSFVPPTHGLRLYLIHGRDIDERFFGFGSQLSYVGLESGCVPIIAREKGNGRGLQPFTFLMNRFNRETGGSWQHAHTAVPWYLTSSRRAAAVDFPGLVVFDLTRKDRVTIELSGSDLDEAYMGKQKCFFSPVVRFFASRPVPALEHNRSQSPTWTLDLLRSQNTDLSQQPFRSLPSWVGDGIILDVRGGIQQVLTMLEQALENNVPLAGILIQDWSGSMDTTTGFSPYFDIVPSEKLYPDWAGFLHTVRSKYPSIKILLYFSPYLMRAPSIPNKHKKHTREEEEEEEHTQRSLAGQAFDEALRLDCLVREGDGNLYIKSADASEDLNYGVVQLLSKRCRDWYTSKIRSVVVHGGPFPVDGWFADHGEGLSISTLTQNRSAPVAGSEGHNEFVQHWLKANDNVFAPEDLQPLAGNTLVITKAWASGNRALLPQRMRFVHNMGYQMSSWDSHDGMYSALKGMISSGLSGIPMVNSFLGGVFNSNDAFGLVRFLRTKELLLRWLELSAFSDAALVSHQGKSFTEQPSFLPQLVGSSVASVTRDLIGIHKRLWPYKRLLMQQAEQDGTPLVRHMWLEFPQDKECRTLTKQFMLGSHLLVCPVLSSHVSRVECYLPQPRFLASPFAAGSPAAGWVNFWTGELVDPSLWNSRVECDAPLGRPCAFAHLSFPQLL